MAWMHLNSTSVSGFWKNAPSGACRYQCTKSSAVLAMVCLSLRGARDLLLELPLSTGSLAKRSTRLNLGAPVGRCAATDDGRRGQGPKR